MSWKGFTKESFDLLHEYEKNPYTQLDEEKFDSSIKNGFTDIMDEIFPAIEEYYEKQTNGNIKLTNKSSYSREHNTPGKYSDGKKLRSFYWAAIYERDLPKRKLSPQLFYYISPESFKIGICFGSDIWEKKGSDIIHYFSKNRETFKKLCSGLNLGQEPKFIVSDINGKKVSELDLSSFNLDNNHYINRNSGISLIIEYSPEEVIKMGRDIIEKVKNCYIKLEPIYTFFHDSVGEKFYLGWKKFQEENTKNENTISIKSQTSFDSNVFTYLFRALRNSYFDINVININDNKVKIKYMFLVTPRDVSNNGQKFILFFKPLTLSSRNKENEINFQLILPQRDVLLEKADEKKAHPICFGWCEEMKCITTPSFEKLKKIDKTQNSIFFNIQKVEQNIEKYHDHLSVKFVKSNKDKESVGYSHFLHEDRLSDYLLLLSDEKRINIKSGKPNDIKFETNGEIKQIEFTNSSNVISKKKKKSSEPIDLPQILSPIKV
ncbi:MAG: hypothetical protein HQK54_06690, partial [Oligoflexales bacterium]|nr:hypothetical protein [Oligoflexales bacterium]